MLQVGAAVLIGRGADGEKDQLPMGHALSGVSSEAQAACRLVGLHQGLQPRLVDGDMACLQRGHFGGIDVHADHIVADVGQHCTLHQADIAGAKNRNFHDG